MREPTYVPLGLLMNLTIGGRCYAEFRNSMTAHAANSRIVAANKPPRIMTSLRCQRGASCFLYFLIMLVSTLMQARLWGRPA